MNIFVVIHKSLFKFFLINIYVLFFTVQAQELKDENSLILNKKIDNAFALYNNNKKEEAYFLAHKLIKQKLSLTTKARVNLLLAYYFNTKQIIDSSSFYNNKTLKYIDFIKNDTIKNKLYSQVSNLFAINSLRKGVLEESKKWHLKGIEVAQKNKIEDYYYIHTHGLARVYMDMKDYKNALKLFNECLNYKEDPKTIYASYINIGGIYSLLKDFDSGNRYYQKALKLIKEDYYGIAVIKTNLASNYLELKNYDKAILFYNEALKLSEKKGYKHLMLQIRSEIGNLYYSLNKYEDAELMFSSNLYEAKKLGYLSDQELIYTRLKDVSVAQKKYRNAFHFATKSFEIKDSITKLQKDKEIDELEVRYKTLEKEKEIKLLKIENSHHDLELKNQKEAIQNLELKQKIEETENENKILSFKNASEKKQNEIVLLKKNQEIQEAKLVKEKSVKNIILYFFLILLVPVIGLLIIYYQKIQTQSELSKKQEEINNQKITTLIKDQELKVIKASIKGKDKERKRIAQELHDSIGGNLAAIKLKLNNSVDTRGDYLSVLNNQIDDTYEQVRNLSHNLIPKKFSKNNFCDVLEEYINSIWGANSSFMVYPRKKIDLLKENLQIEIFKIIQELATNTIKHAQATSIELQVNLVENELNILFEDNGIGFNTKNHKEGIGFENIKNRLKKFQGTFYIDSRIDRGTIINIEIPILSTV